MFITEMSRREIVARDINTMEGTWHHGKVHFERMAGTSVAHFDQHIAEIM